jgi:Tfp pilus assembly protein PilZ
MATGEHKTPNLSTAPRRAERRALQSFATVTVNHEKEGILLDLSETGLRLQTTQTFNPGSEIFISFFLPNSFTLVEGTAKVVWSDVTGQTGVRFVDEDVQALVTEWVEEAAAKKRPVQAEKRPTVH